MRMWLKTHAGELEITGERKPLMELERFRIICLLVAFTIWCLTVCVITWLGAFWFLVWFLGSVKDFEQKGMQSLGEKKSARN